MSATNIGNEAEAQPPLSSIGSPATVINPVPMSFPQILRNSRLSDRFAYLRGENTSRSLRNTSLVAKRVTRDDREGKRWIRRKENGPYTCLVQMSSSAYSSPCYATQRNLLETRTLCKHHA